MAVKAVDAATLRRFLAKLRETCPIKGLTVCVRRRVNLHMYHQKVHAFAEIKGRVATIRLTSGLTRAEMIDCLIHEWAHLLSRDFTHGPRWGKAYAMVYRSLHDCK